MFNINDWINVSEILKPTVIGLIISSIVITTAICLNKHTDLHKKFKKKNYNEFREMNDDNYLKIKEIDLKFKETLDKTKIDIDNLKKLFNEHSEKFEINSNALVDGIGDDLETKLKKFDDIQSELRSNFYTKIEIMNDSIIAESDYSSNKNYRILEEWIDGLKSMTEADNVDNVNFVINNISKLTQEMITLSDTFSTNNYIESISLLAVFTSSLVISSKIFSTFAFSTLNEIFTFKNINTKNEKIKCVFDFVKYLKIKHYISNGKSREMRECASIYVNDVFKFNKEESEMFENMIKIIEKKNRKNDRSFGIYKNIIFKKE